MNRQIERVDTSILRVIRQATQIHDRRYGSDDPPKNSPLFPIVKSRWCIGRKRTISSGKVVDLCYSEHMDSLSKWFIVQFYFYTDYTNMQATAKIRCFFGFRRLLIQTQRNRTSGGRVVYSLETKVVPNLRSFESSTTFENLLQSPDLSLVSFRTNKKRECQQ